MNISTYTTRYRKEPFEYISVDLSKKFVNAILAHISSSFNPLTVNFFLKSGSNFFRKITFRNSQTFQNNTTFLRQVCCIILYRKQKLIPVFLFKINKFKSTHFLLINFLPYETIFSLLVSLHRFCQNIRKFDSSIKSVRVRVCGAFSLHSHPHPKF